MKSLLYPLKTPFVPILAGVLLIAGCSIDGLNSTNNELTPAELEIATQIIGESLSNQNEGIISSLNDAFVIPSESGFGEEFAKGKRVYSLPGVSSMDESKDTGSEDNYSYSYDPETGIHSISFSRSVTRDGFSKEVSADLEYIFYDANGEFIESPRAENDRIETVDFKGDRAGSITTPTKTSSYQRNDQFLADGLSSVSDILQIDGVHEGNGEFMATRQNGDTVERSYTLTIDFLNVQIDKQLVAENGSLARGVTGAVAYELVITRSVNGNSGTKTVNGTIEFNGDGTALLRFRDILNIFRIKLDNGHVFDDDEFEGRVRSVDLNNQSFTLFNGQQIFVTDRTEIDDDGDLSTLREVQEALQNNLRVKAEGDFTRTDGGRFVAVEVKFEDDDGTRDFRDYVATANPDSSFFTLVNGLQLFVTDRTEIDDSGDFLTLEAVRDALEQGHRVEADGAFFERRDRILVVTEVRFELEDND